MPHPSKQHILRFLAGKLLGWEIVSNACPGCEQSEGDAPVHWYAHQGRLVTPCDDWDPVDSNDDWVMLCIVLSEKGLEFKQERYEASFGKHWAITFYPSEAFLEWYPRAASEPPPFLVRDTEDPNFALCRALYWYLERV